LAARELEKLNSVKAEIEAAGLLGLMRELTLELADQAVTVNGVSPGHFAIEMNTALIEDPLVNARFITGADILIDGGWTAR